MKQLGTGFVVSAFALLGVVSSAGGATITISTADGNGADADVRGFNPTDQTNRNLGFHNAGTERAGMSARWFPGSTGPGGTARNEKFWVRFDLPHDIDTVTDARVDLFWNQWWPVVISFEVFGLTEATDYGINGLTGEDRLDENWPEGLITWNNAPGNADSGTDNSLNNMYVESLYKFHSPRNYYEQTLPMPTTQFIFPSTASVEFARQNLIDFLNSDTNGIVTFIVRRPPGGDCMECVGYFASKENTDPGTHPPRLMLEYIRVPEPSTVVLLCTAALGLLAYASRKHNLLLLH